MKPKLEQIMKYVKRKLAILENEEPLSPLWLKAEDTFLDYIERFELPKEFKKNAEERYRGENDTNNRGYSAQ